MIACIYFTTPFLRHIICSGKTVLVIFYLGLQPCMCCLWYFSFCAFAIRSWRQRWLKVRTTMTSSTGTTSSSEQGLPVCKWDISSKKPTVITSYWKGPIFQVCQCFTKFFVITLLALVNAPWFIPVVLTGTLNRFTGPGGLLQEHVRYVLLFT